MKGLLHWLVAMMLVLGWQADVVGQSAVSRAVYQWDAGLTDRAHDIISTAVAGEESANPEAWYVLGFFEKEFYKAEERTDPASARREAAWRAFRKAWALGPDEETQRELEAALGYIGGTYFQDALNGLRGFTPAAFDGISEQFEVYMAVEEMLGKSPEALKIQRAEWERQLGLAFGNCLANDRVSGEGAEQEALAAAVGHYEASLVLEPGHYSTLYNLAITLYNHGVRQLKRIGPETSMFELMEIQDVCIALFEEALPVMQAAHEAQPERLETLKGLMTIHYALSQPTESDRYKRELEEAIRKSGGK